MSDVRVHIADAARRLDRRIGTIRKWEREGRLPDRLRPHRDDRGWRWWTPEQIEGIKRWMVEEDMRPGKGLPHNRRRPSEESIQAHLDKLRQPKKGNR